MTRTALMVFGDMGAVALLGWIRNHHHEPQDGHPNRVSPNRYVHAYVAFGIALVVNQ